MPECTKAEREYLDVRFSSYSNHDAGEREAIIEGAIADLAERRAAEQGRAVDTFTLTRRTPEAQVAYLTGKLAEAHAALAEERAKPKEGAVRFEARASVGSLESADGFAIITKKLEWVGRGSNSTFTGPDAERHAREHAERLQAEHEKGGA